MAKQRKHPGCAVCSYVSMTAPLQSLSVTTLGSNPAMRKRDDSSVQSPIMSPIESRPAPRPRRKLSGTPHFLAALYRLAHHACIWPWFTAEDVADGGGLDRSAVCAVKNRFIPNRSSCLARLGLSSPRRFCNALCCIATCCTALASSHLTSQGDTRSYWAVICGPVWQHLGHGACSMCRHIRVR